MLRFKLGAMLGFAAGWLVASGKASEWWQQLRSRGTLRLLARGDAMQESAGAPRPQRLGRIPAHGQMQRCQHRRAHGRQIGVEVDPMQMHDIDALGAQDFANRTRVSL